MRSSYAAKLKKGVRSIDHQGYIKYPAGVLLAEQLNSRLKNADHQFHLSVNVVGNEKTGFNLMWSVKSIYDFEPFEKNNITDLRLSEGFVLKLHDGLSQHLTTIGIAKVFTYSASWFERWEK